MVRIWRPGLYLPEAANISFSMSPLSWDWASETGRVLNWFLLIFLLNCLRLLACPPVDWTRFGDKLFFCIVVGGSSLNCCVICFGRWNLGVCCCSWSSSEVPLYAYSTLMVLASCASDISAYSRLGPVLALSTSRDVSCLGRILDLAFLIFFKFYIIFYLIVSLSM